MTLAFPDPYTLDSANTWINMNLSQPHQTAFVLCETSSPDVVVGGIGFKPGADTNSHTAELGYWIGERLWGRGYVTEAVRDFTKWIFEDYEGMDGQKLRRLWGRQVGVSLRDFGQTTRDSFCPA